MIRIKSAHTIRAELLYLRESDFESYFDALHAGMEEEKARALQLASEQGRNGCFAIHQPEGKHFLERYHLISRDILTDAWRSTCYDCDGFPIGHHCGSWEELTLEVVKDGCEFVSDIPAANYSPDPKEQILARYDTQEEQQNDFLTLLLFWHLSHSEISKHRKV